MPIKWIADLLGVAQSTVSVWVRDIELTPEQHAANRARACAQRGANWRELNRQRRLEWQREGRASARRAEPLHVTGCMLYWAEGAKDRNCVQFGNSDPAMMRLFKRFAVECFELPNERFSFNINAYTSPRRSIGEIEAHWIAVLELPVSCARKHVVDRAPTSSGGRRPSKLPYGVCCLKITKSTPIIQHIYGAIQEYAGFDEPRWVD